MAIIGMLILVNLLFSVMADCPASENDQQKITAILEDSLSNNCAALQNLSTVFFASQKNLPHSVKVHYILHVPIRNDCGSDCSCWNQENCNNNTGNCPDGYCCIEKHFLWGRVPLVVLDDIYRAMTKCPFIIGSSSERFVTIKLILNQTGTSDIICNTVSEFPCAWCRHYYQNVLNHDGGNFLDSVLKIPVAQDYVTPSIDMALITLTEKLQGFAVKAERLSWLKYPNELAAGFARAYSSTQQNAEYKYMIARYIWFFISYILLHLIVFMIVYKYRWRIYNKVQKYINAERINNAFFFSFIVTIITECFGIAAVSQAVGGLCFTIFQIVLIGVVFLFSLLHCVISICCKLTKQNDYFRIYPIFCFCIRWKWINISVQVIAFWLLYSLPHVILYFMITFVFNFIYNPFSYLILLMYLGLSGILLWIGNAIFFHLSTLFSPNSQLDICRNKTNRRRLCFAISTAVVINMFNLYMWGFIAVYFNDRRGHTSYITFLPGLAITLLGWYLSGDLVKLLDVVTLSKNDKDQNENQSEEEQYEELKDVDDKACKKEGYKQYSINRLHHLIPVHSIFSHHKDGNEKLNT